MHLYLTVHNLWLMTAYGLHLNHCNDAALLVSLTPSVFGMGPSVLLPVLSSSVFRTNLKRQQTELCQKVFCLLRSVLFTHQNCLLVGFLLLTGMLGSCEVSSRLLHLHRFILTQLHFRIWVQYWDSTVYQKEKILSR